ncbi:Aldehyde/histidinol dehydrogenase [Suillus subalutaceus]|uniref:Aldehyde/histidinol dehydrogenase n=1 Tax=Suillus subalutaceus TaxID=48586 RepID=UPI001B885558|nr:Aldehyde/histidinol dehydrogenase [Suillus subalutaceus]KAG1871801.1 Aldehyde/histidinol dehydrogenase [Suillus subalutaceus]
MSSSFDHHVQTTISPHNGQAYHVETYPTSSDLDRTLESAAQSQKEWIKTTLGERIAKGLKFIEKFSALANREAPATYDHGPLGHHNLAEELCHQMGRPTDQCWGEFRGFLQRATYMVDIAESCLSDITFSDNQPGFSRSIKRVPLGVIFVIAPWNYPYLVMINSVLPALIAGNAVILKPSPQTPLTAVRFKEALNNAGFPTDLIQVVHLSPPLTRYVVQHKLVDFVVFTGSVAGGKAIETAAVTADGFKGVGLELGGKDPAYVRADADLKDAVIQLVDGAMYNAGQSCCAIERIYVHESVYDNFVDEYVNETKKLILGDPTNKQTTIGPVISIASAERIRQKVSSAVQTGAKALIPENLYLKAVPGTAFVAPQVLVDVNHTMDVMKEETFGPIIGIQKVSSDAEAIELMNDSEYGLTASIWTKSLDDFSTLADQVQAGTIFLNRCDSLDPALAWTGIKNSGRGVSLSKFGYDQLTRAKSINMRINTT